MLRFRLLLCGMLVACSCSLAYGARPAASLVPNTTKAFLSIPSTGELRKHFDASQLGQLAADPAMKPFVDDLKQQFRERLSQTEQRLGVTLEDIDALQAGEVAIAAVQPAADANQYAFVVLLETTGREAEARKLMQTADAKLVTQGGQSSKMQWGEVEITAVTMPIKAGANVADSSYSFLYQNRLVISSHLGVAQYVAASIAAERNDSLATLPAYVGIGKRLAEGEVKTPAQMKWFVEPFGFVEVMRAAQGGRKKRGQDMLKVLAHQGFNCIQGLGGEVTFSTGTHELLHRTMVYAPAVARPAGSTIKDKYDLAARMLNFPNSQNLGAQGWVPQNLSTYISFNIKAQDAFEYARTLVDEIVGTEGTFDDVIKNLAEDPSGPKIDIRKELVAYLGERVSILTDYTTPINTKSERFVVAVEVLNENAVMAAVNKAFSTDQKARKTVVEGFAIWEIVNEDEEAVADGIKIEGINVEGVKTVGVSVEAVKIEGVGVPPVAPAAPAAKDEHKLPNVSITVAHGHLLVGSNIEAIKGLLHTPAAGKALGDAADYQVVSKALTAMGAASDSCRMFSRTDEEYRVTYEMLREGKMPQAESLLAKLLNRVLATDEPNARPQQIDGHSLPDYSLVRKYLGPAGGYLRSYDDGWLLTGCVLHK